MQGRKSPAVLWLIAAALVGLGIVVGSIVLFQRYHAKTNGQEEQQPKPALPKTNSAPHKAPAPAAPAKSP
jgi:flagellar basal body-associated protein FliL